MVSAPCFWDKMTTVITNSFLTGLIITSSIACSSPERDAYARLAREANPILTAMQPAAARLRAASPEDHAEIVAACWSVEDQLWLLRDLDFAEEHIRPRKGLSWVPAFPQRLLDMRAALCEPGHPPKACSDWCVAQWTGMVAAVEQLRGRAKAEGVEIVSLDPSVTGSPR